MQTNSICDKGGRVEEDGKKCPCCWCVVGVGAVEIV